MIISFLNCLKRGSHMPFDPLIVARQHRNIRSHSQRLQAYNTHIPHIVMQNETLDARLSHQPRLTAFVMWIWRKKSDCGFI